MGSPRGYVLLDALAAFALLGLLAVGTLSLLHGAVHISRQAARLDHARGAVESVAARLDLVSWERLPEYFGAGSSEEDAVLDTGDATAPGGWPALVEGLPEGRVLARLEGVGAGGAGAAFAGAMALRLRVEVSYREGSRWRRVSLVWVRT